MQFIFRCMTTFNGCMELRPNTFWGNPQKKNMIGLLLIITLTCYSTDHKQMNKIEKLNRPTHIYIGGQENSFYYEKFLLIEWVYKPWINLSTVTWIWCSQVYRKKHIHHSITPFWFVSYIYFFLPHLMSKIYSWIFTHPYHSQQTTLSVILSTITKKKKKTT